MFAVVFLTLILFLLFQCYALHSVSGNLYSEIRHGTFWGLIFGAGIFFKYCWKAYGFFWISPGHKYLPTLFPRKNRATNKMYQLSFLKMHVVRSTASQSTESAEQARWLVHFGFSFISQPFITPLPQIYSRNTLTMLF